MGKCYVILKHLSMMRLFLQLCSYNDIMEENSFIEAFRLSFDVRVGLYYVSDRYAFR